MMDQKELQKLSKKALAASKACKFGHYPMAPSVGLSEKQIAKHLIAMDLCAQAMKAHDEDEDSYMTQLFQKAVENHSWVVRRRGTF